MVEILERAAGIGALAWYASSLYVGARLLALGVRQHDRAARWIGTYLFFAMGLGSILYTVAMLPTLTRGAPITPTGRALIFAHFVVAVIANHGLLTFTHRVFRPQSAVARFGTWALLACMIVGALGHGLVTGFDGSFVTAFAGMYLAVPVIGNAWAATESLLYYPRMRRRIALGLSEPLTGNRFLLYGTGAASAAILLGLNLFEMQVVRRATPGWTDGIQVVSLATMTVLGLVCAGAYLFAFFPPRWYVRLIAQSDEGAVTPAAPRDGGVRREGLDSSRPAALARVS